MSKYKFILEPTSKKFICPNCGKKRFVKYIDTQENQYVGNSVGRCDREFNCGYHLTPNDFYRSSGVIVDFTKYQTQITKEIHRKPSFLNYNLISTHGMGFKENNFIQSLKLIFSEDQIKQIIIKYLLGTSKKPWMGSVVFWQIDNQEKLRTGKIINYDRATIKRIKKPYNQVSWVHKTEKIKDFNLSQCLFGLHLINEFPNKIIAVSESEKSACIMSVVYPKYIWLSCGSISNINNKLFNPIKSKSIVLYPDLSPKNSNGHTAYDLWQKKATELNLNGFNITVSKFLYDISPDADKNKGFDIADYFIKEIREGRFSIQNKTSSVKQKEILLTKRQKTLNILISKNPGVKLLIDTFDLQ